LILFGFLGENRRLEPILRALAQCESKQLFRLAIYGTVWDESFVRTLIRDLGLASIVKIHGYVTESQLDAAIASSHLAFNLRFPTLGEASGGILRSWTCGTPTLVTGEGWYKDLPASVAYKISVETEEADIQAALSEIIQNPGRFAHYGMMGQAYVRKIHAPEPYVASLKAALVNFRELETRRSAQYMLRSIASRFTDAERMIFLDRAADKIAAVFGE
jgi:glycosyltransferase involved in cell wall biosynthesis